MLDLVSLAGKKASQLSDADLMRAATALGGSENSGLLDLFKRIRDAEPDTKITDLLKTPTAVEALKSITSSLRERSEDESGVACRCPACGFRFITEL